MGGFAPPLCGCADRSAYVRATHKCETCGFICKYCLEYCKNKEHKTRELKSNETGTASDWIETFGHLS